jgi:putative ABC transport system ATP-binding protein
MHTGSTLIKLEGVKKTFYTDELETHALDDITLEISRGEYVSIAGPSGCGKSTLLSIIGLLETPSDGVYQLNDQSITTLTLSQRARVRNREIGFIFQSFHLIGDLTVYENVELPLTYRGLRPPDRKRRVLEALERVGMGPRARHLPPSILLADEPTGNLDSRNGEAVIELLAELHGSGSTICMVTHDARYAAHAKRTIHLFDGRVVEASLAS